MIQSNMKWIQCLALSVLCLLLAGAGLFSALRKEIKEHGGSLGVKRQLPKSIFESSDEAYASMGRLILQLNFVPPKLHLPDLRSLLIYYGRNGRPDGSLDMPKLHFGMQGGKSIAAAEPGEKMYLAFDKTLTGPSKFTFSPQNAPTPLWFTADVQGAEAKITLEMTDAEGIFAPDLDPNKYITLGEKEFTRTSSLGAWEMGKWRVDASLLARQKARWLGVDKFLENHGGEEYPGFADKQRIDFGDGDEMYSVYVRKGDFLVWDQDKWNAYDPSICSKEKPLLVVKKIDERMMTMDLWDVEGKGKIGLTLVRAPDTFRHEQITRDFRFAGARTKTQVVFQVDDERFIMKPNDWLVLTKEGWRKLKTAGEIDEYVERKIVGPLFIFQEVAKKDEKPVLVGSIYNPNRTEWHQIEVAMLPANNAHPTNIPNEQNNLQAATPLATH